MSDGINLPWSVDTRQVEGRKSEKKRAKKDGVRLHPNSGAGRIKYDGSTAEELVEYKDAKISYAVNANYIAALHRAAVRQDKTPMLIVTFGNGYILRGVIEKE